MKISKKLIFNIVYAVAVIGVVLAVWAIAAAAIGSEFVLPSIGATAATLGDVLGSKLFWSGLGGTLARCAISYAIAVALAFLLLFLCTAYTAVRRIVEPIISALRSLPAVAVTLILILAVGAYGTPIVLSVLVIMPMIYSAARAKLAVLPKELEEVTVLFGANKFQTMKILWLPCLAPASPDILSSALSYNIKTVIGAEILAQTAGSLGMLMKLSQLYLESAMLIAYVIAAVVVSVIAEIVTKALLKLAVKRFAY
ncbi:MAG: ABC transporter permease subunit [Clostridia bacterium]|nr:ABC transporter permease subunit [Clostridia bacterium]